MANAIVGVLSAIVDNIPVMFAVITMRPEMSIDQWLLVTLTTGVGGSLLSIGSAAGVVAMGMEKIDFFWYLKKISWLAFLGFFAGSITFMLLRGYIA